MKYEEITCPYAGTSTHPHIATLAMEPTTFAHFQRLAEAHADVELLGVDRSTADLWTVVAACASQTGRDLLESNW